MRKIKLQKRYVLLFCCFVLTGFLTAQYTVNAMDDAKKAAELMISEKKIEREKEKAMLNYFIKEGKRLFSDGNYDAATEEFSRALEISPESVEAKKGLKGIRNKTQERQRVEPPAVVTKRLLRSGQDKYRAKDYEGATEDFQNALVLDYNNKDVLEWLKRVRRQANIEKAGISENDLDKDTAVATKEKTVQEKTAMLEVEKAYQPPEKPKRKPVEIEEIISPEEERDERARQELMKRLAEKMVPSVTLTEADIRDVIRQLMDITGVTIVIDEGALSGGAPLKITFSTITEMPLLEVLNIALKATELSYRVEPNYIWISTPEKLAKENLVTRTYRLKYGVRRVRKVELKEFEAKSSSGGSSGGNK